MSGGPTDIPPGSYGRAQSDLSGLIADSLTAWDIAITAVTRTDIDRTDIDLDAPSRRRGRTIRDVLLGIGQWPGGVSLADQRQAATRGDTQAPPQRLIEAEISQRFATASIADIATAWSAARDAIAAWSPDAAHDAPLRVGGALGVVPVGTLVGAGSVAIQRSLHDAYLTDPRSPDSHLPVIAMRALIDSVGAVCAQAPSDAPYQLGVSTPDLELGVCATSGSWQLCPDVTDLPRIIGPTEVVWQIASGARSPVTALANRDIEVVDITGLMRIARGLTVAPDLPGGETLRTVFTAIDGVASTASKVGSLFARLWRP